MSIQISINTAHRTRSRARISVSALAVSALLAASLPAGATIDNTATANGTPARGTYTPVTDSKSVPVAPLNRSLTIAKSVSVVTDGNSNDTGTVDGAGDIVTFKYVITNNGNATLTNVTPVDAGPTFNGEAATNSLTVFTHQPTDLLNTTGVTPASVAPGQTVVFTADYTVDQIDFLRGAEVDNGMDNSATGSATGTPTTNTSTVETNIPADPKLSISKTYVISTDNGTTGEADVGDVITYTYTVTNTGNVAMQAISIDDVHEGASLGAGIVAAETLVSDGPLASATPAVVSNDTTSGPNGSWDLLQPGAVITFTYAHTVTQAEFDAQ